MKLILYGLILLLSLSSPGLRAGEFEQPEFLLEMKEPLQIRIAGVTGEELKNVELALTPPTGLVHEGQVDRLWLERFKTQIPEKVRQALEPFGYYEVQARVSLEMVEKGVYRLYVEVEKGRPVRVTSVKVSVQGPGEGERALRQLLRAFPLKEGDVLLHQKYEVAKGNLKTEAIHLGYLDADFSTHVIRISRSEYSAEIELVLETGPQYRFGVITIEGAPEYPERFLRRYVTFQAGEVFSHSEIFQTQVNFNNSDRFREVVILPEKELAMDDQVPVKIKLTPSRPKRLRMGIGYSTNTGARMTGSYQDVNFNHWGHEWNTEANVSEKLQNVVTRYIFPSLSDLHRSSSLQIGVEQERLKTYESRKMSLEFDHSRSLKKGRILSGYLRIRREDFEVGLQKGRSRLIMPGLRFNERHYDDLIRPQKGYRYELEMRGTGKFLGSDTGFLQCLIGGDLILPLPFQFFLYTRAQGGFTLLSDPLRDLPPSVRFFAGGDWSLRGYGYQSLGPRDESGKVVGGKHLLTGSIELERRISNAWAVAAFYDVGNAFNHFGKIDPHHGVGMGVRLFTPIGPLRLDLAHQLGIKDPGFRIHFTVGFGL